MKEINFTSKFIVDKNFYKVVEPQSEAKNLDSIEKIVESPYFTKFSNNDTITVSAQKKNSKSIVTINYGAFPIEINTVTTKNLSQNILRQILLYTCLKNGKKPTSLRFDRVLDCFLNLGKEN